MTGETGAPDAAQTATAVAIAPFASGDIVEVVALWHASGLVVPWNDPHLDIERKMRVDPELFLVAWRDARIVGTVMAGYEGHRGWLNYLAVHPDARGTGVGRRLVEAAERLLLERGCPKVNLQVRNGNRSAIDFYRRLGYAVDDVTSMGKRLVSDEPDG